MKKTPAVKLPQPTVEQMHDSADWIREEVGLVTDYARTLGDDKLLELIADVSFDVDQLKAMLPPRQLKLKF